MMNEDILDHSSPPRSRNWIIDTFVFVLLVFGIGAVGSFIGGVIANLIFGLPWNEFVHETTSVAVIQSKRMSQFFAAISTFILPVIFFVKVIRKEKFTNYFKTIKPLHPLSLLLIGGMVVSLLPFVYKTVEWSIALGLDEVMKENTRMVEKAISEFLSLEGGWNIAFNYLVMAVLAGVTEEIMFRGFIQQRCIQLFKNHHLAIITVALLFSLIHFEFTGLIARWLLGMFFGYIYYWTKNIWYPILTHAFYNGFTIWLHYQYQEGSIGVNVNDIHEMQVPDLYFYSGMLVFAILLWLFYKINQSLFSHE